MKISAQITIGFCIISLLSASAISGSALANSKLPIAAKVSQHVNIDKLVYYSTGINPSEYPCARASIVALYEKRAEIGDLSRFHPKRLFAWVIDTSRYYMAKFTDFLLGLMNPDAVMKGVRKIQLMAQGGNPLAAMDRTVENWASKLSPRSEFVLKRQIYDIIHDTTNDDGSCKLGE